jgi:hypothetical protein
MNSKIKKILGNGLSGSYGSSKYGKTDRAGFKFELSDYSGSEGKYHDEWAAHQNGGGQEIVEIPGGTKATRVYAGGTLEPKLLQRLEIDDKAVLSELMFFLRTLKDKTRLDENVNLKHGKYAYSYKVVKNIKEIPLIVGEEQIMYGKSLVFIHYLINSPVN